MKKLITIALLLFAPISLQAAQQTWNAGDPLSEVRTKIQANDSELYGFFGSGSEGTYGISLNNNNTTFALQSGYTVGFGFIANNPVAYFSGQNHKLQLWDTDLDDWSTHSPSALPLNGLLNNSITTPADADDLIYTKTQKALTLTDIYCVAQGGGTITLTLQECDNATCASPSTIEGGITCDADGAEDNGTLTDGAIAPGAWIKVLFSAPTGTVSSLVWSVDGSQIWESD